MKKVYAHSSVEINVECPHCASYYDLLEQNDSEDFTDVFDTTITGFMRAEELNYETQCPNKKCKKLFIIEEVEY